MKLYIKHDSIKGRGVFAAVDIAAGEVIEKCEMILFPPEEVTDTIERYVFHYNEKLVGLALGCGSLYNHSNQSNAFFYFNHRTKILYIEAKKKIPAHSEITINYGYTKAEKKKFKLC